MKKAIINYTVGTVISVFILLGGFIAFLYMVVFMPKTLKKWIYVDKESK